MEAIFSENTRGEVARRVHADGVQTQKWVWPSLTSASKAHLICERTLCPYGSSRSRTSPSAKCPGTVLLSRWRLVEGEDGKWDGITWLSPGERLKLHKRQVEAFASDRSMLKTVGQQPNLTASHHKTRLYCINAADPEAARCIISLSHRIQLACTDLGLLGIDHRSTGKEMKSLKGQLDWKNQGGHRGPMKAFKMIEAVRSLCKSNKPLIRGGKKKMEKLWELKYSASNKGSKTCQTKSLLTNPAQWWNKIIFRQVNKGERKKQILYMLERIDWINVTLPQAFPESGNWK